MKTDQYVTQPQLQQNVTVEYADYELARLEKLHTLADRQNQVVWYLVGLIETLLLLRFVLHMFGAQGQGFTELLYTLTQPFIIPFQGLVTTPPSSGSYFDIPAFVAMIVIALLGMGVAALIDLFVRPVRTIS